MTLDDLPLADAGRETHAIEIFRLDLTPEEYAARFGHQWAWFSLDDLRYSRTGLTEWLHRPRHLLREKQSPELRGGPDR
jgi:hypothetical protein